MMAASNLAVSLRLVGNIHAALQLDQDTYDHGPTVIGLNHRHTLSTAVSLASDLRAVARSAIRWLCCVSS